MEKYREVILILEFRNPVTFKNGYLAECIFPIGKNPKVQITDIAKDWQLPLEGIDNKFNNPKIKEMTRADFHKTFKITSIKQITGYPFQCKYGIS